MDVLVCWVIQLIDQNELKDENQEHKIELYCWLELSILQDVSEDDDFIKQDKLS